MRILQGIATHAIPDDIFCEKRTPGSHKCYFVHFMFFLSNLIFFYLFLLHLESVARFTQMGVVHAIAGQLIGSWVTLA